jgi:hypothetical protein
MTELSLSVLQESRAALEVAAQELWAVQELVMSGESEVIDRHAIAMAEVLKLKQSYEQQVNEYTVDVGGGQYLRRDQYQMLQTFAANNRMDIASLIPSLTICDFVITECRFQRRNLITLEGLAGIDSIRTLDLCSNSQLTSFRGVPTHSLEELVVRRANVTGDLTLLRNAIKLRKLDLEWNDGIASLKGIPTEALELLNVRGCGLIGDLSEIAAADTLQSLYVGGNRGLTSLRGIPTKSLERLHAGNCKLTGDLLELRGAHKLRDLDIRGNQGITSLVGIPTESLEQLVARVCNLSGVLSELRGATKLRVVDVGLNRGLTSLSGVKGSSIRQLIARECGRFGDLGQLVRAGPLRWLYVMSKRLPRLLGIRKG